MKEREKDAGGNKQLIEELKGLNDKASTFKGEGGQRQKEVNDAVEKSLTEVENHFKRMGLSDKKETKSGEDLKVLVDQMAKLKIVWETREEEIKAAAVTRKALASLLSKMGH